MKQVETGMFALVKTSNISYKYGCITSIDNNLYDIDIYDNNDKTKIVDTMTVERSKLIILDIDMIRLDLSLFPEDNMSKPLISNKTKVFRIIWSTCGLLDEIESSEKGRSSGLWYYKTKNERSFTLKEVCCTTSFYVNKISLAVKIAQELSL